MPPPAAMISRYVLPFSFRSSSNSLEPANTTCVCGSTRPGITTFPDASSRSTPDASCSLRIDSVLPTSSIAPSETTTAPSGMMDRSDISAFALDRLGPLSVTSSDACMMMVVSDMVDGAVIRLSYYKHLEAQARLPTSSFTTYWKVSWGLSISLKFL